MNTENHFQCEIQSDNHVLGAGVKTYSPALIEIYGQLGLDFAWLDFEHGGPSPWNTHLFENLTRAAELAEINLLVRLPGNNPSLIRKVLDAGVRNIMIPRVTTADEVRDVVKAGRFTFKGEPGKRGAALGRARNYGYGDDDYLSLEDETVCIGVQIETVESVDVIEEILSVPELGFVYFGPGDLSIQMGRNTPQSDVEDELTSVLSKCRNSNIPVGRTFSNPDSAMRGIKQGYRIIRLGDDFEAIRNTLEERIEQIEKLQ